MARVIMVGIHKGGVGKTTTTYTLACIAAASGQRVLLCDLDAQGSLTQICTGKRDASPGVADVLGGTGRALGMAQAITRGTAGKPDLAAGGPALVPTEIALMPRVSREMALRYALDTIASRYDLILLDTPAAASVLVTCALTAADEVLIPCKTQSLDISGLEAFVGSIHAVRQAVNRKLKIAGVVATFYQPRLREHQQALADIRRLKLPLCQNRIGVSVRLAEAARREQCITEYAADNAQAIAYGALAKELGYTRQRREARAC